MEALLILPQKATQKKSEPREGGMTLKGILWVPGSSYTCKPTPLLNSVNDKSIRFHGPLSKQIGVGFLTHVTQNPD